MTYKMLNLHLTCWFVVLTVYSCSVVVLCLHYIYYIKSKYSRILIIWLSIIQISGLTKPKLCLPTASTYNAQSSMSDNARFYTFL